MKRLCRLLLLVISLGIPSSALSYSRVSVHDPSIVVDTVTTSFKRYYLFGSHLACAVSSDLKNWSHVSWSYGYYNNAGRLVATDYKNAFLKNLTTTVPVLQGKDTVSVDFGTYNTLQWRYTANNADLAGNQWAPDVIWNPYMRKWCMYMSLNGDNWRSVIALLTADKVTGPYVYQGPVVFSGFHWTDLPNQTWKQTDISLVLGDITSLPGRYMVGGSWGNRWPNNIDPCVFFDDDGQLWMSYGSWSGGIFILKLNRDNGLRDYTVSYKLQGSGDDTNQDPYFGKKIAGGHYVSGEGSYIEKIGRYYCLFMSYGGLSSDGGYEMRCFRSLKPDGDYKDWAGNSAIFSSYRLNYGPSATSNVGTRLFGSYKWDSMSDAEVAQGHNSALLDTDGRAYIIYHTRFANGGEGHQVRVHQLFLNSMGWLLASPYEYSGCKYNQDSIESRRICSDDDIVGTYKCIIHPYRIDHKNKAYQKPVNIYLNPDGTISGAYKGLWYVVYADKSYITIKLNSGYAAVYSGVVLPQAKSGTNNMVVCFTALTQNGVCIWGSKVNDTPDAIDQLNDTTATSGPSSTNVYDLNGRKVLSHESVSSAGSLRKGIYIIGGKKVLVR